MDAEPRGCGVGDGPADLGGVGTCEDERGEVNIGSACLGVAVVLGHQASPPRSDIGGGERQE
jgi:hypothetical protein